MNPKDLAGASKPNLSVIPFAPLLEVIAALTEGRRKYGPWNWRDEEVSETIYADAAIRHLMQFIAGEDIDPDSNIHHISKAIAGLLVVRDAQLHGTSVDDRVVQQNLDIERIVSLILSPQEPEPEPKPEPKPNLEHLVGLQVKNRSGKQVVLERNENERYPYKYFDGNIVRALDSYGRYAGHGQTPFDVDPILGVNAQLTPAGGGTYLISSDDIGRLATLRCGEVIEILDVVEPRSSKSLIWPVIFRAGHDVTTTNSGFQSADCTDRFQAQAPPFPHDVLAVHV